jgi:hypothetical protein
LAEQAADFFLLPDLRVDQFRCGGQ